MQWPATCASARAPHLVLRGIRLRFAAGRTTVPGRRWLSAAAAAAVARPTASSSRSAIPKAARPGGRPGRCRAVTRPLRGWAEQLRSPRLRLQPRQPWGCCAAAGRAARRYELLACSGVQAMERPPLQQAAVAHARRPQRPRPRGALRIPCCCRAGACAHRRGQAVAQPGLVTGASSRRITVLTQQ